MQYRAGYNGAAAFTISVAGFEFFSFDVGTASATFAVSRQRQAMTLATELAPDVSWVPDWIPIVPESRIALDLTATGAGDLQVNLAGSYRSTLPRADIAGSVHMTPRRLAMQGRVRDGDIELPVTFTFQDETTRAVVGITDAFAADIAGGIGHGFDRAGQEVENALVALDNAIEDYQFKVSLGGLRSAIPGVADTAISRLNAIPDQVYNTVRSRVISEINRRNQCVLGVCVISNSTRDSTATSAANSARYQARNEIKPYVAAMEELHRWHQPRRDIQCPGSRGGGRGYRGPAGRRRDRLTPDCGLCIAHQVYNQLRSTAGERQLPSPSQGLTHNLGGMPYLGIAAVSILGLL